MRSTHMRSVIPQMSLHYAVVWLCCCRKRNPQNCCVLTCHENDKANDWRMTVAALRVLELQRDKPRSRCLKSTGLDCRERDREVAEEKSHYLVPSFYLRAVDYKTALGCPRSVR